MSERVSIIKAETVPRVAAEDVNVDFDTIVVDPLHQVVHLRMIRITAEEAGAGAGAGAVVVVAVMVALEDIIPTTTKVVVDDQAPRVVLPPPALARATPALTPSPHGRLGA